MDFRPGTNALPISPDPDSAHSPVAGLAWDEDEPRQIGPHRHSRGHIISVVRGAATVGTRTGVWILPPNRAMWVPPRTEHWVRYSKTLASRNLFVEAKITARFPSECVVLHLDALSRELLNAAVDLDWYLNPSHGDMHLVELLLERLPLLRQPALRVPEGEDRRVLWIMQKLRETPEENRTLAEWSKEAGASERTLARLFLRDTGMSFATWRRQHRLMLALEQLAAGAPVTAVAHNLGYETAGNFSTMFRKVFHQSPRDFFRSHQTR
jgi:AraC-like DNA-binding protein